MSLSSHISYTVQPDFFTESYFRVLAFILVGEVIFIEEKFAYRRSIKKLTVPGEVLFNVRLAGAQAAAETSMRFKYTMCRRGAKVLFSISSIR